ncbi:MAG: tyrosine-protein phosphatase [Actinomycetia bacterium]|nr:tyrosine-protein phosphatase [Actinomycetes bacterium]MCP5030485.1 tyrosine-protein phosphatase [Actinomycetes bacterium]
MPDHGTEPFAALGLRLILDLRKSSERDEAPDRVTSRHHELPSRHLCATDASTLQTQADGERWLHEDYLGMLDQGSQAIGELLAQVAGTDGPVLFHCLGGKDRTGIVAALLLTALGVPRPVVLDDYELTVVHQGPQHLPTVIESLVSQGIAREAATAILSTPRWAMAKALEFVDDQLGGIETYLTETCGLASEELHHLQTRIIA